MHAPQDSSHFWPNPSLGQTVLLFPQGNGRVRAYLCYPTTADRRFSGAGDLPRFVENSLKTGATAEYYMEGRSSGPLATFDGAVSRVPRPYAKGVALIGDAAFASDPTWGQGLSLTLRDARVLRDQRLRNEDLGGCRERLCRGARSILSGDPHHGGVEDPHAHGDGPRGRRPAGQGNAAVARGPHPAPGRLLQRPGLGAGRSGSTEILRRGLKSLSQKSPRPCLRQNGATTGVTIPESTTTYDYQ